jgi:ABC-type phosphate/phosphonate transport system permease subunit
VASGALATLLAAAWLGLDPRTLLHANTDLWWDFLWAAAHPALFDEGTGEVFLVPLVFEAMAATVSFAAAGLGLALLASAPLSLLASTRFGGGGWLTVAARIAIVGMRSVHELLWAILFLAALGLTQISAVIAIAIPFAGTLAKVFSELLDEAEVDAALALQAGGASRLQSVVFGVAPRALPDLAAYALYRFECALRSSAVLGFFGFPTLGYALSTAADSAHFREVWTYLYALFLLVWLADRWSWALRRRLVAP